jgi:hypothetical protein
VPVLSSRRTPKSSVSTSAPFFTATASSSSRATRYTEVTGRCLGCGTKHLWFEPVLTLDEMPIPYGLLQ